MTKRRSFLKRSLLLTGGALVADSSGFAVRRVAGAESAGWLMPDEGADHAATWMAFGPSAEIWGNRLLPVVRENLATIANTIARYEPVKMLVREQELDLAARLCDPAVTLIPHPIDDLWMRDTGPVFVHGVEQSNQLGAVDFNFNGWGNKQVHDRDAKVAEFVTSQTSAQRITTNLVLEGGGVEVDGEGTAIITESCVLNQNRNPKLSTAECEAELERLLGIRAVIWLPGIAGKDITDGHTDFYARFVRPGVVVAGLEPDPALYDYEVTRRHLEILRSATDANGRTLEVVELPGPSVVREAYENDEFAAGYINFYVCNGAVIAPEFGDREADRTTRNTLEELFPDRDVIQLNIDGIAAGGGGIHCTTQQQPR